MNNESKFDSINGPGTHKDLDGKEPLVLISDNSMSNNVHQVKNRVGYAGLVSLDGLASYAG